MNRAIKKISRVIDLRRERTTSIIEQIGARMAEMMDVYEPNVKSIASGLCQLKNGGEMEPRIDTAQASRNQRKIKEPRMNANERE